MFVLQMRGSAHLGISRTLFTGIDIVYVRKILQCLILFIHRNAADVSSAWLLFPRIEGGFAMLVCFVSRQEEISISMPNAIPHPIYQKPESPFWQSPNSQGDFSFFSTVHLEEFPTMFRSTELSKWGNRKGVQTSPVSIPKIGDVSHCPSSPSLNPSQRTTMQPEKWKNMRRTKLNCLSHHHNLKVFFLFPDSPDPHALI